LNTVNAKTDWENPVNLFTMPSGLVYGNPAGSEQNEFYPKWKRCRADTNKTHTETLDKKTT